MKISGNGINRLEIAEEIGKWRDVNKTNVKNIKRLKKEEQWRAQGLAECHAVWAPMQLEAQRTREKSGAKFFLQNNGWKFPKFYAKHKLTD